MTRCDRELDADESRYGGTSSRNSSTDNQPIAIVRQFVQVLKEIIVSALRAEIAAGSQGGVNDQSVARKASHDAASFQTSAHTTAGESSRSDGQSNINTPRVNMSESSADNASRGPPVEIPTRDLHISKPSETAASESMQQSQQRVNCRDASDSKRKIFICEYCDKKFLHKSRLNQHRRIHTGEKPFKCKVCDMKFIFESHLMNHMRTHTGEKPYKCAFCAKKFSRSSNWRTHVRIHTGEKPFKCTICDKTFSASSNRKAHEAIHTGERHYECRFCGRRINVW